MRFGSLALLTTTPLAIALVAGPFSGAHAGAQDDWTATAKSVKVGTNTLSGTYTSLSDAGPMDISWVRDAHPRFTVSGPVANVAKVRYRMKGQALEFGTVKGKWVKGDVKIVVYGPQPKAISLAGSGDVTAQGLQGGDFAYSLAGSGNANLGGAVKHFNASLAGSGDIIAKQLSCDTCRVSIAGSGDVTVSAKSRLDATIAGSSDVRYFGNPKVHTTVIGSGTIAKG